MVRMVQRADNVMRLKMKTAAIPNRHGLSRLAAEAVERLKTNLDGRDKFIGKRGLFEAFLADLSPVTS